MSDLTSFEMPLTKDSVLVVLASRQEGHFIDDPNWSPGDLDYVTRATLAAKLRALADIIDPGTLEDFNLRLQMRTGAESVTRA